MAERIWIEADGARLAGTLHRPARAAAVAVVLHGATGVPQGFYQAFAAWLAEARDAVVLTYDYRDFGASATGHPRDSRATLADWGLRDQAAAQAAVEGAAPGLPLWVIGHSLGGLMLPFQPGAGRVDRLIAVASGPNHVSDHPWSYWPMALSFWHGHGYLATRAMGYLPGKLGGLGEDLPAGVYLQWRRWCTTPGFYRSDIGTHLPAPDWAALRAPARLVAVSDDQLIPPATMVRMDAIYPAADKTHVTVRPSDAGLRGLGHIGVLARRNAAIWPKLIG